MSSGTTSTPLAPPASDPNGTVPGAPPFVLVTGGKGGVGKTTLAANLGLALAGSGARPVLVDLDFALANLDVMLDVRPERTVEDYLGGERPLEACLTDGPGGVRFLGASSGSYHLGRPDPKRRHRLLDGLARLEAGILVGDSPAGIGDDVLDYALCADRVLVVTTPEPAAATDAFGVIKALDAFAAERGLEVPTPELFVNLAAHAQEARGVAERLAQVCERFLARSPRFAGWMPRSRSVLRAGIEQVPFVLSSPLSTAAQSLARLAEHYLRSLPRTPQGAAKAPERHGR